MLFAEWEVRQAKNNSGNVTDHRTTQRDVFAVRVAIVTVETQQCVLRVVQMRITVSYTEGEGEVHPMMMMMIMIIIIIIFINP